MERPARAPRRSLRAALLTAALTMAMLAATPFLALAAGPPQATTAPFGDAEVAVVPYGELVGAADGGSLNAAVVDLDDGWVAAADDEGHVVAAEIPQPQEGRDFGGTASGPAQAGGLPSAFELTETLRADGVTILQPAEEASASRPGSLMRYLLIPLGIAIMAMFIVIGFMVIRGRNPSGRGLGGRGGGGGHGKMRKNALVEPPERSVPGHGRVRRGGRGAARGRAVPQRAVAVPEGRRPNAARRDPARTTGDREDPPREGRRG